MSKRVMQAALAALVVGLFSLQALSQPQTTTKRLCIEAMNLSALRVSSAQGKEVRICVQNGARGNLGPLPLGGQLEACFAADTANRVFRMKEKGLALEQAKCSPGLLPDYGVPTLAGAYAEAMTAFLARCRTGARQDGIAYALLDTAVAPERALREVLLDPVAGPP